MAHITLDSTIPSAGVEAFTHPPACVRCGGESQMGPGSRWGLCRDCRGTMSRSEQEAWK